MKLTILNTILVGLSIMMSSSCTSAKFAEQNIMNEDLSLSRKGETIIRYNAAKMQVGYNQNRNEYRILDDHMGQYYILTCSEMPTVQGQVLKADLQYTTSNNTVSEHNLTFEVQRTDKNGRIWLWNKRKQYGIVIKQL